MSAADLPGSMSHTAPPPGGTTKPFAFMFLAPRLSSKKEETEPCVERDVFKNALPFSSEGRHFGCAGPIDGVPMRLLFDSCALDVKRRELWRAGALVHVEPQVFDLLLHLIENRHQVV